MKYLVINRSDSIGFVDSVKYLLCDIESITYHLACEIYNDDDLAGNDIKPLDTVTVIHFKNSTECTLISCNCSFTFE